MILNVGGVVEVVALFLFNVLGVFYAIVREMSDDVAPTTFSVLAVLELVTESSAVVTLSVEGVGVFSDHVLTLVGGRFVTERVAVREVEYVERMKQWESVEWGLGVASAIFGERC